MLLLRRVNRSWQFQAEHLISLEARADLIARIDEAARFFPRDRMALSTQCGLASVAAGNPIRPETQPAKLKLVADTAHRAWPTSDKAHMASNV
jgi:5-methyltetrahydropteroyltriglutamate--homocysteine methyltransferase